jgi:hypothetical protein
MIFSERAEWIQELVETKNSVDSSCGNSHITRHMPNDANVLADLVRGCSIFQHAHTQKKKTTKKKVKRNRENGISSIFSTRIPQSGVVDQRQFNWEPWQVCHN